MQHSDFKLGENFKCGGKRWLCTDKGTRVIVAVCLTICQDNDYARALPETDQERAWERKSREVDPSWLQGPPYALAEHVFDENDIKGCEPL